jgi:antitoxin component of RelBE/YafQ-DinJ toxin-antitoxin module
LIHQASKVAEEIGATPGEVVRLLFKQKVKRRRIPFPLHADSLEDQFFTSAERRNKLADEF